MKYLTVIVLAISFQLSAQSAAERPSTSLSTKETAAYEAKAESKVTEFYSYLELITDPKGTDEIKQQAGESASKLFKDNTLTANIFDPKAAHVTVAELLQSAGKQKSRYSFKIEDINIEVLSQTSSKTEWVMTYTLFKNSTKLNIRQLFYIITENKKFGSTTKKVINTYLGAISLIQ